MITITVTIKELPDDGLGKGRDIRTSVNIEGQSLASPLELSTAKVFLEHITRANEAITQTGVLATRIDGCPMSPEETEKLLHQAHQAKKQQIPQDGDEAYWNAHPRKNYP